MLELARIAVVVHDGGSSGVGSMAIQIFAAGWHHGIATGTRPAKFDFMRACGAREVLDTSRPAMNAIAGEIEGRVLLYL